MGLRIGISMRETNAENYIEQRDTIAKDWSKYMLKTFPKAAWLFIPNMENDVVKYLESWKINVLFLSGGDDIGLYPERDATERILLKYAIEQKIPVVGICRGMQLIHDYYNGKIIAGDKEFAKNHRATEHLITYKGEVQNVNSYHTNKIDESSLHNQFKITSRCQLDNSIESFENNQILAMMWHPERDKEYSTWNQEIIKTFIKYED